ncbi:MAG: CvpA family protein [Phycisphaerales bacterium]|nr:MAG: CvpA family protein [Phycisphaerales bacterium]
MILSILLLLLILAITSYQAVQGFFNALLMLILTICCVGLAFGVHEYVAINWLSKWRPDLAYPLALALTFAVPLLILRILFDKLVKRACLVPAVVDRIGGGVCGLITSMLMVGTAATAVQMLPLDYNVLGYSRIEVTAEDATEPIPHDQKENELWLRPDRFAAGLGALLADSLFSGGESFYERHPDYIQTIGWVGATHSEVNRFAPPGSVRVVNVEPIEYVYRYARGNPRSNIPSTFEPVEPQSNKRFYAVRVKLGREARSKKTSRHIFTLRQFRIVGYAGSSKSLTQVYPIAIQCDDEEFPGRHIAERIRARDNFHVVDRIYEPLEHRDEPEKKDTVEVVFELPRRFRPLYLEYKLGGKTSISLEKKGDNVTQSTSSREIPAPAPPRAESPAVTTASDRTTSGSTVAPAVRGGRARKFTTRSGSSFFGDELPVALTDYEQYNNFESHEGVMSNGHVVASLDVQKESGPGALSKLEVPSDKRLLHLNVAHLQPQSLFGKIKGKAISTLQNFIVEDANGNRYKIIGKYAIAELDNQEVVMEVQYYPEHAGTIGGLGEFRRIKDRHLEEDYDLVFLFLVDPGARILYFSTGGTADRRDDLQDENLVAPN